MIRFDWWVSLEHDGPGRPRWAVVVTVIAAAVIVAGVLLYRLLS